MNNQPDELAQLFTVLQDVRTTNVRLLSTSMEGAGTHIIAFSLGIKP